jgi:uncharacterized protein
MCGMFSKLIPKELGFFDLFDRHCASALEGTRCLLKLLETWPEGVSQIQRIEELEHECDSITHMTVDLLHRTFITPLDRDEILKLLSKMDDVIDSCEVVARRMKLFEITVVPEKLKALARTLVQAHEVTVGVIAQLNGLKDPVKIRTEIKEIHRLENDSDRIYHDALGELFHEHAQDPLTVIKLKEILETVEYAADICEDIGNIVEGIVLEHS